MLPARTLRPLTRDELRSVDQRAISEFGMSGLVLMENAGRNAANVISARIPTSDTKICIVCGKGNNAGDGFVIARHLELLGVQPLVFLLENPEVLAHDARVNHDILANSGHCMSVVNNDSHFAHLANALCAADIVIDALIGTGLHGSARGQIAEGIRCINRARIANPDQLVVSIDIPSGMDCNQGFNEKHPDQPLCVRADLTITFVATKIGFRAGDSSEYLGEVVIAGIGAPQKLLNEFLK